MVVTLKILTDITKPTKNGDIKIIKRNTQYLKQFNTENITIEQYLNKNGVPSKKWCYIKDGEQYYRANHSFEELEKLNKRVVVKGFI